MEQQGICVLPMINYCCFAHSAAMGVDDRGTSTEPLLASRTGRLQSLVLLMPLLKEPNAIPSACTNSVCKS